MIASLIENIKEFNKIIEDNKHGEVIDLLKYEFLEPPVVLPLLQYMELNGISKYKPHHNTKSYLEKILSHEKCKDMTFPLRKLKKFNFKDYFQSSDKIEMYLSDLTDEIVDLMHHNVDKQGINLLFYEMLTNVYKHSKFNNAYILSQKYPKVNTIDICIIDDGITIPGSFEEVGMDFSNDSEAIFNAVNGATSDKEKAELHGRGLNTSAAITTSAYGEEMLIASRNGLCNINKKGVKIWNNRSFIDGTFVTLRINTNKISNIYKYTVKQKFIIID